MDDSYREVMERRFAAERVIFLHGYVPFGFVPGVTVEDLEAFAQRLDADIAPSAPR